MSEQSGPMVSALGADEFRVWLPLMKSEGSADERPIRGCASAEEDDLQAESVIQKGMDFKPCLERGYINWDHKESPNDLLGRVRVMEIVRAEDHPVVRKSGARGMAAYVEGFLWPSSYGHRGADDAWALARASADSGLPLGWSIQGKVVERAGKRITKSEVRHLALTHQPVHRRTFAELVKSFESGTLGKSEDSMSFSPLLLENLDGKLTSTLWGDHSCGHFKKGGKFVQGVRGAMEHLVKCHKEDVVEAHTFLKSLIESGLLYRAA